MEENLTLGERALLHLYRYRHIPETVEFGAPREITQDGVAEALGISRSHSAVLLKKLEAEGRITSKKARINCETPRGPRKVHIMTPLGNRVCADMIEGVDGARISSAICPNNINYCHSSAFWSLPEDERNLIGCILVLRVPVRRSSLPTVPKMLPFDRRGMLNVKPETRRWFTQRADLDTLRCWHSAAADWCSDHGVCIKEKLFHLFRSNRHREAAHLIADNRYELMEFPDKESRDIVDRIARAQDDGLLRDVSARMSLGMGDTETARRSIGWLACDETIRVGTVVSEILLAEGRNAQALDSALEVYVGDAETAATLGICMAANGRYEEAITYLDRCRSEIRRTGCTFRMDQVLRTEAEALMETGRPAVAESFAIMADCWRRESP